MEADQFRSALRTRPFRAFKLRTSSGETCSVKHPEMVAITPSGRTVLLALDEGFAVVDMTSITEFVVARSRPSRPSPPTPDD
jgi:hypothetical protein